MFKTKAKAKKIRMANQNYSMPSLTADGSAPSAKITISVDDCNAIDAAKGRKRKTAQGSQSIFKDLMENMIKRSYH